MIKGNTFARQAKEPGALPGRSTIKIELMGSRKIGNPTGLWSQQRKLLHVRIAPTQPVIFPMTRASERARLLNGVCQERYLDREPKTNIKM